MELSNARYILFLIDSKIKDHHGKVFSSLKDAKYYAMDAMSEKYADKAVIGMFVWNDQARELLISMVETIGFKKDKTNIEQLKLFNY